MAGKGSISEFAKRLGCPRRKPVVSGGLPRPLPRPRPRLRPRTAEELGVDELASSSYSWLLDQTDWLGSLIYFKVTSQYSLKVGSRLFNSLHADWIAICSFRKFLVLRMKASWKKVDLKLRMYFSARKLRV